MKFTVLTFIIVILLTCTKFLFGYDQAAASISLLLISPTNKSTLIFENCNDMSIIAKWNINIIQSYNGITDFSIFLESYSILFQELYDTIEIHGIKGTEYQSIIPPHWCGYNIHWSVRAFHGDGSYTDSEKSSFVVDSQSTIVDPTQFDCFVKFNVVSKKTQKIVRTAQISFNTDFDLFDYSGYYLLSSFEGTFFISIKDKCHQSFSTLIFMSPGRLYDMDFELIFNCHSIDLNSDGIIDVKDIILALNTMTGIEQYIIANNQAAKTVTLQSTIFALQYISGL